jgi:hypothetical protein
MGAPAYGLHGNSLTEGGAVAPSSTTKGRAVKP